MYSLIQSETFRENKAELPLAIGQTVENAPFILDLTEISHLLMLELQVKESLWLCMP